MSQLSRTALGLTLAAVFLASLTVASASAAPPTLTPVRTVPFVQPSYGAYTLAPDGTFWSVAGNPSGTTGSIVHLNAQGGTIASFTIMRNNFTPLDIGFFGGRVYVSEAARYIGDELLSWSIEDLEKGNPPVMSDSETSERFGSLGFSFRIGPNGVATAAFGQANKIAKLDLTNLFYEHPYYNQEFLGAGINVTHTSASSQFETCQGGYGPAYKRCGTEDGDTPERNGSNGFNYPTDIAIVQDGLDVVEYMGNRIAHVRTTPPPPPFPSGPELDYTFGAGILSHPESIVRQPGTGNLFVSNEGTRRIDVFSEGGAYLDSIGFGVLDGTDTVQTCGPGIATCHPAVEYGMDSRSLFTHLDFGPEGDLYAQTPIAGAIQVFSVTGGEAAAPGTGIGSGGSGSGSAGGAMGAGKAIVGKIKLKGAKVLIPITCLGGSDCLLKLLLEVPVGKGAKGGDVARTAARPKAAKAKGIRVGNTNAKVPAGTTKKVAVALNGRGKDLLKKPGGLEVSLTVTQTTAGHRSKVLSRSLRFR